MKDVWKQDKILLPLSVLALILISYILMPTLITFIISFSAIILVSAIVAFIEIRQLNKTLLTKIKNLIYVLTFTILITLLIAVILPYLLFHDSFLNLYIIQYIYLFPVLLVFFVALHIFTDIVDNIAIRYRRALRHSIVIALVFSIILSIVLLVLTNIFYAKRVESYNTAYEQIMSVLMEETPIDLPIYFEIKEYQDNFIAQSKEQKLTFQELDKNKGLCITNCFRIISDKAFNQIKLVADAVIIISVRDRINYSYHHSLNNYSLGELDTFPDSTQEEKNLALPDSDFTYSDYQELVEELEQQENFRYIASPNVFGKESIFLNSLSYVFLHSSPGKEVVRLVFKVYTYLSLQTKSPRLYVAIYNNKDINEPIESKLIRYELLLEKLEKS
jgi:hypothetical protein